MRFCGNCGTRLPTGKSAPSSEKRNSQTGPLSSSPETGQLPALEDYQAERQNLGILTGPDLLDRFRRAGLEATGQRRSVTVLFVDLTGYTHLSEQISDELLYDLIQKFIRVMVDNVYRYEGMVDKLTGDGLMALFGAPIAYENNAERAVRAALDMQDAIARLSAEMRELQGHQLQVHIGINAGSVIVGGVGSDALMNYTAIGDSVNLARRLEEAAAPATILVSESVFRQNSPPV